MEEVCEEMVAILPAGVRSRHKEQQIIISLLLSTVQYWIAMVTTG